MPGRVRAYLIAAALCAAAPLRANAAEWFVAPGGAGPGSSAAPFGRIQDGINAAQPGDTVTIRSGTYLEALRTVRSGLAGLPIRIRSASGRGTVMVTTSGKVLNVGHAEIVVEGLVLDGQYGLVDTVQVGTAADSLVLRNTEIRRSTRDLVDIAAPQHVLIDGCLIHHALNAAGGRTDAHGIAAGAVRDLVIRDTEIHTFSGDGVQVDPGRAAPGWNGVTIEGSRIWLAPLPTAENGFPAGTVPGENAVDTKASSSLPRATIAIRDTTAWGFRKGLIGNMAAFNLKENINAIVDRVTVYDSEIAFRLRGPAPSAAGAWVTVQNAVVHDTLTAFRYEDNIEKLNIWNSTVGNGVTRAFQAASSTMSGLEVRNVLLLNARPAEASHPSNLTVGRDAFANVTAHDYQLAPGAVAIDAGLTLPLVKLDRVGVGRPQGAAYDVGAYESRSPTNDDVVAYASRATLFAGTWTIVVDPTAAGGMRLTHPNVNARRITAALATPVHYFELIVPVQADVPYRLWLRGRADQDDARNDSVYVQFSGSVRASGAPTFRIGTTSATTVQLSDCGTCALSNWGWQDNGYGVNKLGPLVQFKETGLQTVRIQTREDGFSIDQIVLSPQNFRSTSPGSLRNDTTILAES
jgi:hypothetical protein